MLSMTGVSATAVGHPLSVAWYFSGVSITAVNRVTIGVWTKADAASKEFLDWSLIPMIHGFADVPAALPASDTTTASSLSVLASSVAFTTPLAMVTESSATVVAL